MRNLTWPCATLVCRCHSCRVRSRCTIEPAVTKSKGRIGDGRTSFDHCRRRPGLHADHRRQARRFAVGRAHRCRLPVRRQGVRLDPRLRQGRCRPRGESRAPRLRRGPVEPHAGVRARPLPDAACFAWSRRTATELAALESRDTGKPVRQGRADVAATMRYYEFYGGAGDKIHGDTIPFLDGYTALTLREPHGVVAGIIPWNYPLQILARVVGAALAMGNTLVVKPAEDASLTTIRMAELALEAGFPDGVFNVVTGYGRDGGRGAVGASRWSTTSPSPARRRPAPRSSRRPPSTIAASPWSSAASRRRSSLPTPISRRRCRSWSTRSSRMAARPARPAAAS